MVTVSAFEDGLAALRTDPLLLVAGLLVGVASQLQSVALFIESPALSAGVSLAWLIAFPFALGGFIGTARAALEGADASLARFLAAGRTNYVRLLAGTVLFALLVLGTAVGLVGFVLGAGVVALAVVSEAAALVAAAGSVVAWLLSVLVVVLFVQFYDAAIVVDGASVTDSFRRSAGLFRSNLASAAGFSAVWFVLLNAVRLPEYLLELTLAVGSSGAVPPDLDLPLSALLVLGVALSAAGFAYLYTVYAAYYLRLTAASPADPASA
jgi:hypothetical protein